MEQAIAKAKVLIEAMEYIQRFAGKTMVIKLGGAALDDAKAFSDLITDVVFMNTVGIHVVIVHGGGKAINNALEQVGLTVQFIKGQRYTDQRTLTVVEHVLCNEINQQIVSEIERLGAEAMGLNTLATCVLFGEKMFLEEDGKKIDLGMVGKITEVNVKLISLLCRSGTIPVIAPLARDKAGGKLNCNADSAAGEVAAALKADKFVVVSDVHGIRAVADDPNSLSLIHI